MAMFGIRSLVALFFATAFAHAGSFSADSCMTYFETMKKLGGPVPPNDYVEGCDSVCGKVRELKEYWKTGDMASFACEEGARYGCVWATAVPPVTMSASVAERRVRSATASSKETAARLVGVSKVAEALLWPV
eukprot:CAMPEP_0176079940 /NCGR_PEP_ID=MMETSP0120_2-20121206/39984_1 /TAXON_ID=160619 /ORGANISM="Kryptoperidinium foliaceum, Strain CCMP 1326" /LENGTH=132 /DNA_ID=CAMNT_0017413701 /DNA_START=58 /DNA_END=454 /DNA_ORIENTATION=+